MNNLFKPSQLVELCKKYGLSPSKKYGQNYLISKDPVKKMIEAGELSKGDNVVEIGPGFGILTLEVAPLVKKVVAFEIEKKLQPYWEEKMQKYKNIEVVWGNVLKEINSKQLTINNSRGYKVLANLPYQITSKVLRTLLELKDKPEKIIVMVQKEVAERICAKPGNMSVLAVSVQYYGEPKIITKVSRENFWPVPKVDSAVIEIRLNKTGSENEELRIKDEEFFKIVRAGFLNKRKQLWRNLATNLELSQEEVKLVLKEVVGNKKVRAEELGVEEWKKIVLKLI